MIYISFFILPEAYRSAYLVIKRKKVGIIVQVFLFKKSCELYMFMA